ncbi:MAG: hypothetical protein F6K44_15105 [Moorea sp. SIO3E2]|nr:hypothetical protein [Moorena sp. SIO3E2]
MEWASGVERASCPLQSSGGQDAHSTPIHSKIQQRPKLDSKPAYSISQIDQVSETL